MAKNEKASTKRRWSSGMSKRQLSALNARIDRLVLRLRKIESAQRLVSSRLALEKEEERK